MRTGGLMSPLRAAREAWSKLTKLTRSFRPGRTPIRRVVASSIATWLSHWLSAAVLPAASTLTALPLPKLPPILRKNISREGRLMTDDARHYIELGRDFASHESVTFANDRCRCSKSERFSKIA